MDISVVIPVYGCRKALPELHRRLCAILDGMAVSYEIILVNDSCPQDSWSEIEALCARDDRVIGIDLSRNFGQIIAITAGLDHSHGEYVVVMDCDLQDRPEGIKELYDKIQEGYDVVFARRKDRKDSSGVKFLSKAFYKVYDYFTDGAFDNSICNFSISKRMVIDAYCSMRERNRGYTLFIRWLGFKQAIIDIEADERYEGKSSYNLRRKFRMAFELITSQSTKPLRFAVGLGAVISLVAFAYVLYLIVGFFLGNATPLGWRSTIASIYFMAGLILVTIGIVGLYVGNIFEEVKRRPLYVVRDMRNGEKK